MKFQNQKCIPALIVTRVTESEEVSNHFTSMHSNKIFKCSQCDKAYNSKGHLKRHSQLSHQFKETPLKCYFCEPEGKQLFSDNSEVFNHMRGVHLYEYPFKCRNNSWCVLKFSNTNIARTHKQCVSTKAETPEDRDGAVRVCYFCGKKFNRLSHLSVHLSSRHTFEKPFCCNLCFAKFSQSTCLRNHIAVMHTRELSYSCHYSDLRTITAEQLNRHCKKIHKTGTLLTCNVCKATCESISTLWEHVKLHRRERPFVCYFCVKANYQEHILDRHMKKCHLRELASR